MAVYKTWQISVIVVLVLLLAGGVVALLRPELVPVDGFKRGVAVVSGYFTGKNVEKEQAGAENSVPVKKDIFRIDLKTGGRIYTDNLKKSDGTFTYTTSSGLVVTIQGHEVMGLITFKEGEEPNK